MSETLALELPLTGKCLIEASAGTGKTYTIADFFVRQLIEGGREVDQVLVVTFTRAATAELRDRIRRRIVEAVEVFSGGVPGENLTLAALRRDHPDPGRVADALRAALVRIDEAPICTIHSFCQQMLRENAFESGIRFDASLELDEAGMLQQIIQDFWRQRLYPESVSFLGLVRRRWRSPADLLESLRPCLGVVPPSIRPQVSGDALERASGEWRVLWAEVSAQWPLQREAVSAILRGDKALSRSKTEYNQGRVEEVLAALDGLLATPEPPPELPTWFEYFTASRVRRGVTKKAKSHPEHPFLDLCETVWAGALSLVRDTQTLLVAEALAFVRSTLEQRKQEQNALSYTDLLTRLHTALQNDVSGSLGEAIRRRFPVALIDEFQDTDSVQYEIFRVLYDDVAGTGLFMIGDPKQAIYSFRGADVFTYMQARDETPLRYTLGTNWRSTPDLVAAVNLLFQSAPAPFVYQRSIPFRPAEAALPADAPGLRIGESTPAPLQVWYVTEEGGDTFKSLEPPRQRVAELCAAEIGRLILLGRRGEARIGKRALAAADITVLVPGWPEAELVQGALRRRGIASVFLVRRSVLASEEATELRRVLEAIAEPGNERYLRAALSTRLLGMDAEGLLELQQSEASWEDCLQRFQDYRTLWGRRGFMVMFQRMLSAEGVIQRVLGAENGERSMTNLRHLGECLQTAASVHTGAEQLVAWLRRASDQADGDDESQQLRLESDEALVRIETVHKSKGLQYPVVFVPFAWLGRREMKPTLPVRWHPEAGSAQIADYGSSQVEQALAGAERERLAEDVRLLYVALTRAQYLCYLPFAPTVQDRALPTRRGLADSALAWLLYSSLYPESAADPAALAEQVHGLEPGPIREPWTLLAAAHPNLIDLEDAETPNIELLTTPEAAPAASAVRSFRGSVEPSWVTTSYSRLSTSSIQAVHPAQAPDRLGEARDPMVNDSNISSGAERTPLTLPRGRETGNLVHDVLERLDFPQAHGEVLTTEVSRQLQRYGFDSEWQEAVETLVGNTLDTRLGDGDGFALREVESRRRLAEMEFHFRLGSVSAADLDRLLRSVSRAGGWGPSLGFETVSGFLTGFVDLLVESGGRYYVIDYKTNHLGGAPGDYNGEALVRAIGEHRYDLQYLLYLVALHRYLTYRLPGYRYETHIGGVYYLFVRAMGVGGAGVYFDRPSADAVHALDRLLAGKAAGGG